MERTLELVGPSPELAVDLLRLAMDKIPGGATFLVAAIALMPDDAFPELTELALDKFEADRGNHLAESLVQYCSLQSVGSLHPHLSRVFELAPNGSSYYTPWPWRESGKQHFEFLRRVLEDDPVRERRLRAWDAMFETREPDVLQFAMSHAGRVARGDRREAYLLLVGFEARTSGLRKLHADSVYHVFFPEDYLPANQAPPARWQNLFRQNYPTWRLADRDVPKMVLGGQSLGRCACCDGKLHHLITLEPIPLSLGITGLERLELASCLSCLGWEQPELFYKHDQNGSPQQTGFADAPVTPPYPAAALEPTEVRIAEISHRWKWHDDASSNGRESLHRVGGAPCWIQDSQYPICPECSSRMTYLLKIASGLPTDDGRELMWGDSGIICYAFWCEHCKVTGLLWQCY